MVHNIYAMNGIGPSLIMTAMGSHLTHEAMRERRAAACAENKNKVTAEKRRGSFAGTMVLREEYEKS
jgi:hypothetical protein